MNNDMIDTLLAQLVKPTGSRLDVINVARALKTIAEERNMVFVTGGIGDGYEVAGLHFDDGQAHVDIRRILPENAPAVVIGFKRGTSLPGHLIGVDPFDGMVSPDIARNIYEQCARSPAFFVNMLMSARMGSGLKHQMMMSLLSDDITLSMPGDHYDRGQHRKSIPDVDYYGEMPPLMDIEMDIKRDHQADHGDRTNHKIRVQPYWQRGRNGKPKGW